MGMLWKLAALLIAFSGTASARLHGFLAGKTGGFGPSVLRLGRLEILRQGSFDC